MLCDSPHLGDELCVSSFKPSWEVASWEPLRESAVVCFQNWGFGDLLLRHHKAETRVGVGLQHEGAAERRGGCIRNDQYFQS